MVDAETLQAPFSLGNRVFPPGMELRRDEDLVAWDAALLQSLADALLVPVGLGRVDVW